MLNAVFNAATHCILGILIAQHLPDNFEERLANEHVRLDVGITVVIASCISAGTESTTSTSVRDDWLLFANASARLRAMESSRPASARSRILENLSIYGQST